MLKNPSTNAGDAVSIPGSEDPLEEEMASHSSNLAWRIPWTEEPGGLQSMGLQRVGHDRAHTFHFVTILSLLHSLSFCFILPLNPPLPLLTSPPFCCSGFFSWSLAFGGGGGQFSASPHQVH